MLFDARWHAFRVFGGIPGCGIYDNIRTAVDRVSPGKQRDVNARFLAMTSHYVFEPEFCNPVACWEKSQVKKNVRDPRHPLWQVAPVFADLEALNDWLVIVAEGQVVCEHLRILERSHRTPGRVIYDWRHYLAVVQRKPGALRNGTPFVEMPDAFRKLQSLMLRKPGGDREMVDILSAICLSREHLRLMMLSRYSRNCSKLRWPNVKSA